MGTIGRLSKLGNCAQCGDQEIEVSWHVGSRRWYCERCWPRPRDVIGESAGIATRSWDASLATREQLLAERDRLFGIRVEDSLEHTASFRVRCPGCGWLADNLALSQARTMRDSHTAGHVTPP